MRIIQEGKRDTFGQICKSVDILSEMRLLESLSDWQLLSWGGVKDRREGKCSRKHMDEVIRNCEYGQVFQEFIFIIIFFFSRKWEKIEFRFVFVFVWDYFIEDGQYCLSYAGRIGLLEKKTTDDTIVSKESLGQCPWVGNNGELISTNQLWREHEHSDYSLESDSNSFLSVAVFCFMGLCLFNLSNTAINTCLFLGLSGCWINFVKFYYFILYLPVNAFSLT